jgi:hypothetical protein
MYVSFLCSDNAISWSALDLDALVQRLCGLTIDTLAEVIKQLPPEGCPAIYRCSCSKTSNGLAVHIHKCLHFLLSAGSPLICDIWLSHFPFQHPHSSPDSCYILDILEFKYGLSIVQALSHTPPMVAQCRKHARKEQRYAQVVAASEEAIAHQQAWPVCVPQQTVLTCLNAYYCASQ